MGRAAVLFLVAVSCTSVRVVDDDDDSGGASSAVTTPTTSSTGGATSGGAGPSGGADAAGGSDPSGGAGATGGAPTSFCTPGEISTCYEGPPESNGVGSCTAGARACLPDGSSFGPCLDQVLPAAVDDCQTAADDDCDGFAIASCEGFFPLPPNASNFGWQTLQERFVKDGVPCRAEVTVATGYSVVCYAGADDEMYCAGTIYAHDYGGAFTDTGLAGPLQILIGDLNDDFSFAQGSDICALLRDGTLMCQAKNAFGQLGLGHAQPVESFTAWGGRSDIVRVATGTLLHQVCALTTSGDVLCAGEGFGNTPVLVGNAAKVWVDMEGAVHLDESPVERASQCVSTCTLDPSGFDCPMFTVDFLVPNIVDGGPGGLAEVCYLQASGAAACIHLIPLGKATNPLFEPGAVLALGLNAQIPTRCAVYNDGSLWCIGPNWFGQLGFATPPYSVDVETQVAPPGSVRTACD